MVVSVILVAAAATRSLAQGVVVSVATDGTPGDSNSLMPGLSATGRFVAFMSFAASPSISGRWHDRRLQPRSQVWTADDGAGRQGGRRRHGRHPRHFAVERARAGLTRAATRARSTSLADNVRGGIEVLETTPQTGLLVVEGAIYWNAGGQPFGAGASWPATRIP